MRTCCVNSQCTFHSPYSPAQAQTGFKQRHSCTVACCALASHTFTATLHQSIPEPSGLGPPPARAPWGARVGAAVTAAAAVTATAAAAVAPAGRAVCRAHHAAARLHLHATAPQRTLNTLFWQFMEATTNLSALR